VRNHVFLFFRAQPDPTLLGIQPVETRGFLLEWTEEENRRLISKFLEIVSEKHSEVPYVTKTDIECTVRWFPFPRVVWPPTAHALLFPPSWLTRQQEWFHGKKPEIDPFQLYRELQMKLLIEESGVEIMGTGSEPITLKTEGTGNGISGVQFCLACPGESLQRWQSEPLPIAPFNRLQNLYVLKRIAENAKITESNRSNPSCPSCSSW
jgi:hypothetical protein